MTLEQAIKVFEQHLPNYKVIGYWTKKEGYVLNAKPIESSEDVTIPGQYLVTNNGKLIAVNPMTMDLKLSDMVNK